MTQDEFTGKKPPCDLVMKGGFTSDLVYPLAVVELAKKYRFSSIGGTSAGALAAAITAAGEYGRDSQGFLRIAAIPDELSVSLFDQFQPEPKLRPLFDMLVAALGNKGSKAVGVISAAVLGYPTRAILGLVPGLLVAVLGFYFWRSGGWIVVGLGLVGLGLLLALIGAGVLLVLRVWHAIATELPAANFGLCSGRTMPGCRGQGMTDWLADTIDRVAGHRVDAEGGFGAPLTFGDLKDHSQPIELAMITTDLAMKRPYRLPFHDRTHFFSKGDFEKLFPPRVVLHMCENTIALPDAVQNEAKDLYRFPEAKHFPVVVAARMSLSLPFLIQAIPVYKCDETLLQEHDRDRPRKCLFSDGGLTSNFPIHFFDRLWPNSPTFAISLDDFSKERNGDGKNRVHMATNPREGQFLPIDPISGIGGFILRLLDAAKDWQDNLQSVLPGYRERIVHVALKPEEGGLDLMKPPGVIEALARFGKEAGIYAPAHFNMDEHRWRRFLIAMAEIEQMLDELAQSHDESSMPGGSFGAFLDRYEFNGSYRPVSEAWKQETLRRAKDLVEYGRQWRAYPTVRSGRIPKPECDLRIMAKQ